jgi:hypothetical protein
MPEYKILFHENDTTEDMDVVASMESKDVPSSLSVGNSLLLRTDDDFTIFKIKSVCHEASIVRTNELSDKHRVIIQLKRQE